MGLLPTLLLPEPLRSIIQRLYQSSSYRAQGLQPAPQPRCLCKSGFLTHAQNFTTQVPSLAELYKLRCPGRDPGCFWGRTQGRWEQGDVTSYPFCTFLIRNRVNVSLCET